LILKTLKSLIATFPRLWFTVGTAEWSKRFSSVYFAQFWKCYRA